ncbi:MAG: glycoside hydrolase [Actinomycetota bacterium]|nr:glycoside hydrolase [Actinomycetota bacterium]
MRRGAVIFLLLAGLFFVTVVVRAVTLVRASGSWTTGRNTVVNRPSQLEANNSPSLTRNPREPSNLALAHRVDRPTFSAFLHWTADGGASWHQTDLPLPEGLDRPFAPDAVFASDGTLYVSYVNLTGNGNVPDNLWVARSTDGGRTLSPPVRVAGRLAFQARMAVGRDATLYVTWLQAREVALFSLPATPNPIVVSRSTDGGRSFSPPVPVSEPGRERVAAATPVVDDEGPRGWPRSWRSTGRLLVLYEDFKSDRRDFEFLEGPPAEEPFALVLTASTNGGHSFSPGLEVESHVVPTRRFLVFLPEFPSIAVGPDGSLLVAWADGLNGDEDVFLRRSEDGGQTWTEAVRVNDNGLGDGTSQYMPRVAVAPSGRIDIIFLDRRRDPANIMTDAFLATSDDGGRSFSNVRLSSESFDSRVGPYIDATFPIDFGSRLGIVSNDDGAVAAWTDSRFGTEGTGRQDVVAATISRQRAGAIDWAGVALLALLGVGSAVLSVRLGGGAAPEAERSNGRRDETEPATGSEMAGPRSRP